MGMWVRISTSRLAFINGMAAQPNTAPRHQTGTLRPKARKKFSVLMASSRVLQTARTRLLGGGSAEAAALPKSSAAPVAVLTAPRAASPPPWRESSMAGNAAL